MNKLIVSLFVSDKYVEFVFIAVFVLIILVIHN
jgi:hypothetical protein